MILRLATISPNKVESYMGAVNKLGAFLSRHSMPTRLSSITREHIQEFIRDLSAGTKGSTANTPFRSMQRFVTWCVDELPVSPMERMTPPRIDTETSQALAVNRIQALLKVSRGKRLAECRDTVFIRTLYDTGMRRGELAGLTLDDLDIGSRICRVRGKTRRVR